MPMSYGSCSLCLQGGRASYVRLCHPLVDRRTVSCIGTASRHWSIAAHHGYTRRVKNMVCVTLPSRLQDIGRTVPNSANSAGRLTDGGDTHLVIERTFEFLKVPPA